jgi:hypothetical protein
MPDRASPGRDLLSFEILKAVNVGIARHQDRQAFLALPDGADRLHRHIGGRGESKRRIPDQPGFDRAGAQRLQQRRRGRKFLPLDLVGHVLEDAGRFHHSLGIALLIADPQRRLGGSGSDRAQQQARNEDEAFHSAATPRDI